MFVLISRQTSWSDSLSDIGNLCYLSSHMISNKSDMIAVLSRTHSFIKFNRVVFVYLELAQKDKSFLILPKILFSLTIRPQLYFLLSIFASFFSTVDSSFLGSLGIYFFSAQYMQTYNILYYKFYE